MELLIGKKILMLLDNPFVSDVRVQKEATSLIQQGAAVTVLCTKENGYPESESRDGIQIRRVLKNDFISPLGKKYKTFLSESLEQLKAYDFDVLHCHDFHMLSIGAEFKRTNPNIKLVYDAHEYLVGWPYYLSDPNWFIRLKGKLVWNQFVKNEKRHISMCDLVITVTDTIAEKLKSNNNLTLKPSVVGNYPPQFTLTTDKKYFRNKFNISDETNILVHSGTIYHTDEQLESLFNYISQSENVAMVFIGNRPRFYEVQKMVEANRDLKSIFFHEYFNDQKDNINLISNGDIGLLHVRDKWEAHRITFSNRFVEYLSAGLPVVATPQEFAISINNQFGCCEFYNEDNEFELASSLGKVRQNLKEFSKRAGIAKKSLSWEKEVTKLIKLYAQLTKN